LLLLLPLLLFIALVLIFIYLLVERNKEYQVYALVFPLLRTPIFCPSDKDIPKYFLQRNPEITRRKPKKIT
jgi:hypothetical protein